MNFKTKEIKFIDEDSFINKVNTNNTILDVQDLYKLGIPARCGVYVSGQENYKGKKRDVKTSFLSINLFKNGKLTETTWESVCKPDTPFSRTIGRRICVAKMKDTCAMLEDVLTTYEKEYISSVFDCKKPKTDEHNSDEY
jgi:hypothetical protein